MTLVRLNTIIAKNLAITLSKISKKLVLVLVTFALVTRANKKVILKYIYYLLQFKKNQVKTLALINMSSKINSITLVYAARIDFDI